MICLNNIIGLSQKTATCFPDKPITDTSLSGLYIDEIEPLKNLAGAITTENSTVWTAMVESRRNAILETTADIVKKLSILNELKRDIFKGGLGDGSWNANLQSSSVYSFVRFYCDRVKGGYLKINNISTLFAETGVMSLQVIDRLGASFGTLTLNKVADTITSNVQSLNLPLWSEYSDKVEYFFIFQNENNTPKNNKLWCDCSGKPFMYNLSNCDFQRRVSNRFGWANWIMAGGGSGNDITTIRRSTSANDNAMGLLFDIELRCDVSDLICKHLDFSYNPISMSIAYAVYWKTAQLLMSRIINNSELNRESQLNAENYEKFMTEYKSRYEALIEEILPSFDLSLNDCLMCRKRIGNYKLLA